MLEQEREKQLDFDRWKKSAITESSVHCGTVSYLIAEICDKHGLQKTD